MMLLMLGFEVSVWIRQVQPAANDINNTDSTEAESQNRLFLLDFIAIAPITPVSQAEMQTETNQVDSDEPRELWKFNLMGGELFDYCLNSRKRMHESSNSRQRRQGL